MKPKLCDWDASVLATHFKLPQQESKQLQTKRAQRRLMKKGLMALTDNGRFFVTIEGVKALHQSTSEVLK